MTEDFVTNKDCNRWFHYIYQTLKKPILLVLTTSGKKWQQSDIGIQVTDQVCSRDILCLDLFFKIKMYVLITCPLSGVEVTYM